MASAVERLNELLDAKDRHDIPHADLLALQIEAADERLQTRREQIALLRNRAEQAGVDRIRRAADLVPLLLDHTAYKAYPDSWFFGGKWDLMNRWLDSVSTYRVEGVDTKGVEDVDDWLRRLWAAGHYVSCSSGTTGKCSMITASATDRASVRRNMIAGFEWAVGVTPAPEYTFIRTGPVPESPRNDDAGGAMNDGYGVGPAIDFPGVEITVGQVSKMVAMRKAIADGTALPAEIAAFEATTKAREKALDEGREIVIQRLIDHRDQKLIVGGMTPALYKIAEGVRARGYSGKDFHPDNIVAPGGGLKGAVLPEGYREYIRGAFNARPDQEFQLYSMQELGTIFPRCSADRYHAPPWVMVLLLNPEATELIEPGEGEQEGRAAFFDMSIDGRWGGLVSGDRIFVNYGKCACGHEGPSVSADISRYSDLPGGDKISCSGTVDAYVRGAA
jgi:hypothetical protein